jgi:hypothetical protein
VGFRYFSNEMALAKVFCRFIVPQLPGKKVAPEEHGGFGIHFTVSREKRRHPRGVFQRFLKKSRRVLCPGVAVRYAVIRRFRSKYPVPRLCRVLEVSTSGYYAWLKRPDSPRNQEEKRLELEIIAAHKRTEETYGPERLQKELACHSVHIGVHRIKRIRRQLGLRCKQVKKFKATANANHTLPVATNLLEQNVVTEARIKSG